MSTRCFAGEREDRTGPTIVEALRRWGLTAIAVETVADDRAAIAKHLRAWGTDPRIRLVVTTGGTGLSPTDVTPEATRDVVDRAVPGIAESIRNRGLAATPLASLARGEAGLVGDTLIVNLPGSPGGVRDGLAVLEAIVIHALEIAASR